jgi:hypothetical protein
MGVKTDEAERGRTKDVKEKGRGSKSAEEKEK